MSGPHQLGSVDPGSVGDRKRALRSEMRRTRRALDDRPERSRSVVDHLTMLPTVADAGTVHVYEHVPGEVETDGLIAWAGERGIVVRTPDDDVDPSWPDVIVVPGTAFTSEGHRLGQGGGWYDRFLPGRRPDAFAVGLAFLPQIVDDLPVEEHDVILDCVVTEDGPRWPHGSTPR
ncbi:MAG: 5-formyltetrahydrofolate cyclo-ligase [Actinomycetota bacterium]